MPRRPPELSEAYLRREARRYLQRWVPSERRMREVLKRRVRTCVEAGTGTWAQGLALVDQIVADLLDKRVLDDVRVARLWADDLHRRGTSRRAIVAKLQTKGIDRSIAQAAVVELDDGLEAFDPELERAVSYVRRRRLGPMRVDPQTRSDRREKDLAAVARAGFPFGIALQVIDAADPDALDALIDD